MAVDSSYTQIAGILRSERSRRGLTQGDLADFIGVSRTYVAQLESGKGTIQLRRLIEALAAVGVDLVAVPRS